MPTANTMLSIDSVKPTVATALAPSLPTHATSTTANKDSSTISNTIGTASNKMARFKLPPVKSWCEPLTASTSEDHRERCGSTAVANVSISTLLAFPEITPTDMRRRDADTTTDMIQDARRSGRQGSEFSE